MPCSMFCVLALVLAVTFRAIPAQATIKTVRQTMDIGDYRITNIGRWTADTRKDDRPEDLWRYYMHGVVDHFATPVPWEAMLGPDQAAEGWLTDQPIDTPYKQSNMPALVLDCTGKLPFGPQLETEKDRVPSRQIDLAQPVPVDMAAVRGKRLRLFVWHKGDDIGARNNCWHSADIYVTVRDADGNPLSAHEGYFQTLRTFPWHCYYTDTFVPEGAAGVYLRFYNKFHGVAYFSNLSWEVVNDSNTYDNNEKQDPFSGSLAFNPIYQEMPYHLKWGFGSKYPWRFVLGEKIGLAGQPYDITTNEGFRKYYLEEARTEPEHMNHGILYMQSMYRNGMAGKMLPPMEDGWLENFAKVLMDDQDPETGYWHDGVNLSLGLTFHLVDMHFRYYDMPRPDREDQVSRGHALVQYIPRAKEIILTSLAQQSSYTDEQGVHRKAAWNWPAYRLTTQPDQYEQKCYLGTTWDAICLIRRCSRYVDEDLQEQVYESVKAAFRYVLHEMVYEDGTFRQRDTDEHPTSASYMGHILQDSSWLERRITADVPVPKVEAAVDEKGRCRFRWVEPSDPQNSVRIYVAPNGTAADAINESHLAGIIHRTGEKVYAMDPLLAVQKIRRGTAERWGGTMELPPANDWRGRRYLPWKLRMVAYDADYSLPHADQAGPLSLTIEEPRKKAVYVSAATWYGEECTPVKVELTGR